ncbi:uncharacterized protein B0H18DRAFT_957323 [Fomitopsis serialis]|uniref:uncharacterized protein n=1 Tax=Fomitopsis serialis TaxID=139415 RepID=UPI0020080DCB|nr:uncharacterized protein B0H18DRAFT_957323 [Neoantrodia serialis]KAH9919811.1 hypothetical protein B0H18DRAFT_957323 [Neoantrodia serialis]
MEFLDPETMSIDRSKAFVRQVAARFEAALASFPDSVADGSQRSNFIDQLARELSRTWNTISILLYRHETLTIPAILASGYEEYSSVYPDLQKFDAKTVSSRAEQRTWKQTLFPATHVQRLPVARPAAEVELGENQWWTQPHSSHFGTASRKPAVHIVQPLAGTSGRSKATTSQKRRRDEDTAPGRQNMQALAALTPLSVHKKPRLEGKVGSMLSDATEKNIELDGHTPPLASGSMVTAGGTGVQGSIKGKARMPESQARSVMASIIS